MEHVNTEKLVRDMRAFVEDAEELLKATAGQTGEHVQKLRERAATSLRSARVRLQEAGQAVEAQARHAAQSVSGQVHEHPWTAVGIAAGVGALVAILLARR